MVRTIQGIADPRNHFPGHAHCPCGAHIRSPGAGRALNAAGPLTAQTRRPGAGYRLRRVGP